MPNASSSSSRAGTGRRCARGDLLTVALAVMLCSATYCLSIWHNGRNAADKIVIVPAPVVSAAALCGGRGADSDSDELDFEAHHTAEGAGLSVSTAPATTGARRALRVAAAAPVDAGYRGTGAAAAAIKGRARAGGDMLRFRESGAVRA